MINKEELLDKIYKKAIGYNYDEVVEEYTNNENELVLIKRKITTKNVPPDLTTLQYLLEKDCALDEFAKLSDKELQVEKKKLIKLLKEKNNGNKRSSS